MFGRSPPACSSLFLAVALALSLPGGYHYLPNTCLLENFDLPSLRSLVMHFFFPMDFCRELQTKAVTTLWFMMVKAFPFNQAFGHMPYQVMHQSHSFSTSHMQ